ncbi:MAG: hypothetical protein ACRD8U_10740 [Pyrinomonadaceae bacterium]
MTLLGPQEIREKSRYAPVEYIRFQAITMETDTVVVRLSVVIEVTQCFGGYRRVETPFTYQVERVDNEWKARLIARRAGFVFTKTNKTDELSFQ